jgi:type IV secretory pathway VirB10-like protein
MSSRLEQFVRDHREEFDAEEPDSRVWEKIRTETDPRKKKPGAVIRLNRIGWAAAAAVVLLAVVSVWFFSTHTTTPAGPAVANQTPQHATNGGTSPDSQRSVAQQTPHDSVQKTDQPALADIRPKENNVPPGQTGELENSMNEEMYHYAKLVEIKHNQLKTIEKDEPLLYKQFSADVYKLDSVFHTLQNQLPTNPNREQLLEAMLQNLQLQMGLLNHQLDIIKQINHSKKTAYEEAHKTA